MKVLNVRILEVKLLRRDPGIPKVIPHLKPKRVTRRCRSMG